MDILLLLVAFVSLLYFTISMFRTYNESFYIRSDVDNNSYIIRRGNDKSKEFFKDSANTLAEINTRITKLIEHLSKKYDNDLSKRHFIKKLKENYNSSILSEAAYDNRYTTYTIDKQDIHVCLRTRDGNDTLYDINLLMYVIIHELAHLCNYDNNGFPIQGHGIEFKNIFKLLITESISLNIYKYEDYLQNPKEYCGITITTNILPNFEYNLIKN